MYDGWFNLIYAMCDEIQAIGGDFVLFQTKQEFKKLRVYYNLSNSRLEEIFMKY